MDFADELNEVLDHALGDVDEDLRPRLIGLHIRYATKYGKPIYGGSRAVYRDGGVVHKLPLTDRGMFANGTEALHPDDDYIPLATCHLHVEEPEGIPVLTMQAVKEHHAPYNQLPDWAGWVDCGQVGFTENGTLVAYDL